MRTSSSFGRFLSSDLKRWFSALYVSTTWATTGLIAKTVVVVAFGLGLDGRNGVLAYSVIQCTREIGLRMALGAQQSSVLRLIVGEGMMVGLGGIAAGLAGAYVLSRALAALLFGVEAHDPLTFGTVAVTLMAIALAACLVPAWRGSRIDPIVASRED